MEQGQHWKGKLCYAYGTSLTSATWGNYIPWLAKLSGLQIVNKGIPAEGITNLGGYNRALSNRGCVVVRGQEAPIIGRVCMDQFMVDVTDIPGAQRGDVVELIGDHISVERMANTAGISPDEVVCGLTKRVPRVYTAE